MPVIYPCLSDGLLEDEDLFVIAIQEKPQLAFASTRLNIDRQVTLFLYSLQLDENFISCVTEGLIKDGRVIDQFLELYSNSKLRNKTRFIHNMMDQAQDRCAMFGRLAGNQIKNSEGCRFSLFGRRWKYS